MYSYRWIVPFCIFLLGYYLASTFWPIEPIETPYLLGLSIADGCVLLSKNNLTPVILEKKIDQDLLSGTIISQLPSPGTAIKQGQSVKLIITQQPPKKLCPHYQGLTAELIQQDANRLGLLLRAYNLSSTSPGGTCIGQWPPPEIPLDEPPVITLYYAQRTQRPVIIPSLQGHTLFEVQDLCLKEGINQPIVQSKCSIESPDKAIIIDQRPLAGSIMLPASLQFHLQIIPK